jgi:hypothetical protein
MGINYQTHTHILTYAHNTLVLSVCTISAAGHMLHTHLSRVSLCNASLAVLTCTHHCCARVNEVVVL